MSSAVTLPSEAIAEAIIELERAALDRWANGDPDGFLNISADEVVYFDPFQPTRVDSRAALKKIYDAIRGQIRIEHWRMVDPKVSVHGEVVVLTFQFVSEGDSLNRWNTTEVYQCKQDSWRIIHTHWSLTQPKLAE